MRNLKFILLFSLLLSSSLVSQTIKLDNFIPLSLSVHEFKDQNQDRMLTEIDLSFYERHLRTGFTSSKDSLDVVVNIYSNEKLVTRGWHLFPMSQFINGSGDKLFIDQFLFHLTPGSYSSVVTVENRDKNNPIKGTISTTIDAREFVKNKPSDSDPIITNLIEKPEEGQDRFVKSGLYIQPYPQKTFYVQRPLLYYYWEVYNTSLRDLTDYQVTLSVQDKSGENVKTFSNPTFVDAGNMLVCMGGQNVMALKNGKYELVFDIVNENGVSFLTNKSSFTVFKKKKSDKNVEKKYRIDAEYDSKSEFEIDDEIKMLKYIMPDKLKNELKVATLKEKKITLTRFWKANDYDKSTPENEFKSDYLSLVDFVREQFSSSRDDGIDTDMGRVVLSYGKPDHTQAVVDDEIVGKNVMYWKYEKYSGRYFLFVQENFIGPFIMVHSNMTGEVYDRTWEVYINSNRDILF